MKAILFDLDETIILDEAVSQAAFLAAARLAAPAGADPERLARAAGDIAQQRWEEGPYYAYSKRIGHSAWEGLWATYEHGEHPAIAGLRAWAPGYRLGVWNAALAAALGEAKSGGEAPGRDHSDLPARLAEAFVAARRSYPLYPEIAGLLAALRTRGYLLGIVTNGVPDLQRGKLAGCGVAHLFQAAVVSGEIDCGKPDPGILTHICRELGVAPADCVMVGDNPGRDVAAATAAGMKSVWVQRNGRPRDERHPADLECTDLSAMLPWLEQLEGA